MDWLAGLDSSLLLFVNRTLGNPVGDLLWPLITGYDRLLPARILLAVVWLWLLIRGGRRGRTVALLLPPLLLLSDQVSSSLLKDLVGRPRPCHEIGGIPVVAGIRLLVDCGPGMSFPSSHAVNNFAVATLCTRYYPRGAPYFFIWASLVALSRVAVGVHFPSDVLGGAAIGSGLALLVLAGWGAVERRLWPREEPA